MNGIQGRYWSGVGVLILGALAAMASASDTPIQAAVSVPPQAYLVDKIGGDRVAVQVMIPPGASPATYEPWPQQLVGLEKARLYVEVGHAAFPFEVQHLTAIMAANPKVEIVNMAAGLQQLGGSAAADPHIWLSPSVVRAAAGEIAAALARIDPDHRSDYEFNLREFLAEIDALDRDIRASLAGLERHRFLVFHPAWGHFAAEYGLEQVAIEADGKEPGPAQLVALIEEARHQGLELIFVQQGFSDRSARAIAREIGARVVVLDPLAYDWEENLRRVAAALRQALADSSGRG
jgi:zinc transport system substrate-binding protein